MDTCTINLPKTDGYQAGQVSKPKAGPAKVVVAMSGGVDSSVAAFLLKEQGHEVVGISMRLWGYEKESKHGCCTPEDLYDARRVADQLSIPYFVVNMQADFDQGVVKPFVASYAKGETPNPCVKCNQEIKFKELLAQLDPLGCDLLATGHYAQKSYDGQKYHLLKAVDPQKDQTYFLFGLGQYELSKIIFPLGHLTKPEVREIARKANLRVSEKKDSQEICFVPNDYKPFVEKHIQPKDRVKGKLKDTQGNVLGEHEGIHHFTIGQRKGLEIPKTLPMYVSKISPQGDVIVGKDEDLYTTTFTVNDLKWTDESLKAGEKIQAKIRSRFEPVAALIKNISDEKYTVEFENPQRAITPGQAAVFYRGESLVGGGWIVADE